MKNRNITILRIATIIAIICNLFLPSLIDNFIVGILVTSTITIIAIIILLNLKPQYMTPKTLSLNIELCDSGAILSDPDDGCKYAYSDETKACRSIANDIEHLITHNIDTNKFNIHIEITPQYAEI